MWINLHKNQNNARRMIAKNWGLLIRFWTGRCDGRGG